MKVFRATTEEELRDISSLIHDAYFDPARVIHDESQQTIVVPFAQEAGPWHDLPQPEPIRKRLLSDEYRVPFMRGTLRVHNVLAVQTNEDWYDEVMLYGVEYDERLGQVKLNSIDDLRATVTSLHVEAELTPEVDQYIRRRIGLIGETDTPWDQ